MRCASSSCRFRSSRSAPQPPPHVTTQNKGTLAPVTPFCSSAKRRSRSARCCSLRCSSASRRFRSSSARCSCSRRMRLGTQGERGQPRTQRLDTQAYASSSALRWASNCLAASCTAQTGLRARSSTTSPPNHLLVALSLEFPLAPFLLLLPACLLLLLALLLFLPQQLQLALAIGLLPTTPHACRTTTTSAH